MESSLCKLELPWMNFHLANLENKVEFLKLVTITVILVLFDLSGRIIDLILKKSCGKVVVMILAVSFSSRFVKYS